MMYAATLLMALVLSVATSTAQDNDNGFQTTLLRILSERPWINLNHWERLPGTAHDLDARTARPIRRDLDEEPLRNEDDEMLRMNSNKRSAVATALNAGRRRRQPTPALGKAVTPYVGVGVLNDMSSFFDSLRGNLETLASLSPQERSSLFADPPTVKQAQRSNGVGSGSGMRRLHALRPLRPTGNIRSYNRRSDLEAYRIYPGANNHDPGLLWTGLGR